MAKRDPIAAAVGGLSKPSSTRRSRNAKPEDDPGIGVWKTEIAFTVAALVVVHAIIYLPHLLGIPIGVAAVAVQVWQRDWLASQLMSAQIKRRWLRAQPLTRVRRVETIPSGERLHVKLLTGSVHGLETKAGPTGELAAAMRVREVRVRRHVEDGSRALVTLIRHDPFIPGEELPWPNLNKTDLSVYDPIPIGISDENEPIELLLPQHNMLVGGEPGSGKSAMISMLCATGARDKHCKMWLFDGKEIELSLWGSVADRFLGADAQAAVESIQELETIMAERLKEMKRRRLRVLPERDPDFPPYLIIVDELAWYINELTPKKRSEEFEKSLRALVARGRAAGMIVIATMHKPAHDMLPTALRDLFGYRLAMRCTTWQASDAVLGQGWHSKFYDASTIPGGQRGVGYLLAESADPDRIKGYYLSDGDVNAIAGTETDRGLDAWIGAASATDVPDRTALPDDGERASESASDAAGPLGGQTGPDTDDT